MYGVVKVGNKEVEMCANAATPVRYRQVFGKNLLTYFLGRASEDEMTAMIPELAYIMAMSAAKADMNKLSIAGYIEWLEGFEGLDFLEAATAEEIMRIYQANELPDAVSKKKQGQRKGK